MTDTPQRGCRSLMLAYSASYAQLSIPQQKNGKQGDLLLAHEYGVLSGLQPAQCLLDGRLYAHRGLLLENGLHRLLRGSHGVAQHGEGSYGALEHLVCGVGGEGARDVATHRIGAAYRCNLVFQLHDDALGSLATDALDHLEQLVVARADDLTQLAHAERREDGACRVASDTRHGDEQQEQLALALVGKAEEHMGIFADVLIDVELRLRAVLYGRVGMERDVGKVAHAVALDGDGGGGQFGDVAFEIFYHMGMDFRCFAAKVGIKFHFVILLRYLCPNRLIIDGKYGE